MSGLDTIRTDVVGSLLRPDSVKKARADWDAGKIDLAERTRIEDEAVRDAIKLQEAVGLDVVSDGEMRRLNFQDSFGESIEGYDAAPVKMHTLRTPSWRRRLTTSAALRRSLSSRPTAPR